VWDFTGPMIAAANPERITFKVPAIRIDDAPPTVEGFDVVKPTFNFTGLYDGTNPTAIEYVSTDITL